MPEDNFVPDGVSIIICCYNSSKRIAQTLAHLALQVVPPTLCWEIILVNNASEDNTEEVATTTWNELNTTHASFKIISELNPGQIHARKKGVEEAKYDCIIFCDDDNWLHKDYVALAKKTMLRDNRIGAAGGQNFATTDATEYPGWFEEYKDKYAISLPVKESGDISARGFILGAGMVTRKLLFMKIFSEKYPSLLQGKTAGKQTTGDDFEYCKRLLLRGYSLYYEEKMMLWHFIPKDRLSLHYREKLMQGIYEAGKIINVYDRFVNMQLKIKNKNKFRLLLLAPFRIFFAEKKWSGRNADEEKLRLFYVSPFSKSKNPAVTFIKKFILKK